VNPWYRSRDVINLLPDSGMNAHLTSPGASGYALLPALYETEEKGYSFYVTVGHGDDRYYFNEVWFAPAVVRWWSVFDENGQLYAWAREDLDHAEAEGRQVAGPPVAIRGKSAWFGSHGYTVETPQLVNMVYPNQSIAHESSCCETMDDLTSYAPTYLLTPLSDDAATSISSLISYANRVNRSPWTLNVNEETWNGWIADESEENIGTERAACHCPPETREEKQKIRISRDESCDIVVLNTQASCQFTGECPCDWPVHTATCECGSDDRRFFLDYMALRDAIYDGMFTVPDHILESDYHYVWDYAVHRYLNGLQDLYNLSHNDELIKVDDQAWYFSLWQQQSPYRDLHTLQQHLLKQSELLTSSRKQQEFSRVS
jgi:hypothetical protein